MGVKPSKGPESTRSTIRDALDKPIDGHALLAALAAAGVFPGSGRLVLIVDDDRDASDAIAGLLAHLGCRSLWLESVGQALEVVSTLRPAAVVLDLDVPEADTLAYDLAERSRERPLPIIRCRETAARRVA